MRKLIWGLGGVIVIGLIALGPIYPSFVLRNGLGDIVLKQGYSDLANTLYASTANQGSMRGENNVAVIFYVQNRHRPEDSDDVKRAVTQQVQRTFIDLGSRGYTPAQYNNAMFHYRCKTDRACYRKAVNRLRDAEANGDPLAPLALAMQLAYRDFKHEDYQEHANRLERLAKAGNPIAAYNFAAVLGRRPIMHDREERKRQREEVKHWQRVAADGGLFEALELVGLDAETEQERAWLREAIKQGSAIGAKRMGDFEVEEGDLEQAAYWYAQAVNMAVAKAKRPKSERDPLSRIEHHSTGLRIKKVHARKSLAPLQEIHQGAYDLAMMHLEGKLASSDRARAENYFQFAGTLPMHDSGLITALMGADEARGGGMAQHQRENMGFHSLQYMRFWDRSDKELTRYPSTFLNAIERGDLRAITVLDYYNWKRQPHRIGQAQLDKVMTEFPSSRKEREHIELFVPIVRDIDLPDISDMPDFPVTLINTSSGPKPDWVELGYKVLDIGLHD